MTQITVEERLGLAMEMVEDAISTINVGAPCLVGTGLTLSDVVRVIDRLADCARDLKETRQKARTGEEVISD
jgi:hypothetical protein